jgi:Vitamin K-dependent gamma-carboxylase
MTLSSVEVRGRFRPADELKSISARLQRFVFPAVSDSWLTILRIGLGLQVILCCLSIRRDWSHLFAANGGEWVSRELLETIYSTQVPLAPRVSWILNAGSALGLSEETMLTATWICLFASGCALLFGFLCRPAAIAAWFLHFCTVTSGGLLSYGMDNFTIIGLFYLMLAPFPDRFSLDARIWKSSIKDAHLHGFFQRVLQLHLSIIYFFAGLTKCLGAGWWNGESMWRALTCPPFNVLPTNLIMVAQPFLPLAGIAVCILETSYPLFIWLNRTRRIWFFSILAMHVGIGMMLGLYLFALIMIILNLAAFGPQLFFRRAVLSESGQSKENHSPDIALAP